jgi:RNA polymerase sigma factor (sigma-70 family)
VTGAATEHDRLAAAPAFSAPSISGMKADVDQTASVTVTGRTSADLDLLLGAIACGERNALKQLYERTSAKLYGICLRMLADEAEAQDVLQDVFTTVWTKAGRFDPAKAGAITWLSVLARNKAIDRLRSRRAPGASIDEASAIADDGPTALDVLERSEDAARLADCLGELDERARTMIRAAFFDGLSYPELAEREAVPLGTMKSWIRRGLMTLRGCLDR